jgi:hypothetical protein
MSIPTCVEFELDNENFTQSEMKIVASTASMFEKPTGENEEPISIIPCFGVTKA